MRAGSSKTSTQASTQPDSQPGSVRSRLRGIQNFFEGALFLLALVAVALISAITTMHFAIHGAEVKVPSLKGMTVAEARSQTSGLGLNLDVDNRYYSADVAAGHILSQSPAPNSVVRREWRVRVSESLGPQKVEVPNVVGNDERAAAMSLRRAGLETGITAHLPWRKSEIGNIIAQDPPARAQGIERPSINLLIAVPDDTKADGFVLPDFVGKPIVTAQAELNRAGLKSGEPIFQDVSIPPVTSPAAMTPSPAPAIPSGSAAPPAPATPAPQAPVPIKPAILPGTVLGQSPPSGYRVDGTSIVTFTVAK